MSRKTEGLSYPANPLDAIRELQELDAAATQTPKAVGPGAPRADALPIPLPASSEVAHATSSAVGSVTPVGTESRPRFRRPAPIRESAPTETASGPEENPVARAMREMLARPYTFDAKKGPFTVSTVKIPTEVWERLGWAVALTDRPKQEIIAEALQDYFATLLRGRGR